MSVLDLFSLAGRVVVVTGAGSGLGRAIAEATCEAGAAVMCACRSETADATAEALRSRGGAAESMRVDVRDESSVEALMRGTAERLGSVDVVFCNAGTSDYYRRADETTLEEWSDVIATNLTGPFLCVKHAVPHMLPRRRGKIVITASIWGEVGSNTIPVPAYVASKAGVIGLTKELAMEYGPFGITVNAFSPGFFATSIGADKQVAPDVLERLVEEAIKLAPIHRFMDPSELKGTAVFLASAASDVLNGHVLTIDGGTTAS